MIVLEDLHGALKFAVRFQCRREVINGDGVKELRIQGDVNFCLVVQQDLGSCDSSKVALVIMEDDLLLSDSRQSTQPLSRSSKATMMVSCVGGKGIGSLRSNAWNVSWMSTMLAPHPAVSRTMPLPADSRIAPLVVEQGAEWPMTTEVLPLNCPIAVANK